MNTYLISYFNRAKTFGGYAIVAGSSARVANTILSNQGRYIEEGYLIVSTRDIGFHAEEITNNRILLEGVSPDGMSAYDLAIRAGFKGTLQQWLDSLKGSTGDPGYTPKFQIGGTVTLPADSEASVSIADIGKDTAGNPIYQLNFGIPKGQDFAFDKLTPEDTGKLVTLIENKAVLKEALGKPGGVATLDENGKIPSSQIVVDSTETFLFKGIVDVTSDDNLEQIQKEFCEIVNPSGDEETFIDSTLTWIYIISDSTKKTKGGKVTLSDGWNDVIHDRPTSKHAASIGDFLILNCQIDNETETAFSVFNIIANYEAEAANGDYPGNEGLMSVWDKTQVNKIPSLETIWNYLCQTRSETDANKCIYSGIYPYVNANIPTKEWGTIQVNATKDTDSNGYYSATQFFYYRGATDNSTETVWTRTIFYKGSESTIGNWEPISNVTWNNSVAKTITKEDLIHFRRTYDWYWSIDAWNIKKDRLTSWDNKLDNTKEISTSSAVTLSANKHVDITPEGDLTISISDTYSDTVNQIYSCTITTGDTVGTITLPDNVNWGDDELTFEANKLYEINIRYHAKGLFGVIHSWSI